MSALIVAPKLKSAPEALFPFRLTNPATFKSVISLLSILRMGSLKVRVIFLFPGISEEPLVGSKVTVGTITSFILRVALAAGAAWSRVSSREAEIAT